MAEEIIVFEFTPLSDRTGSIKDDTIVGSAA
jgi:hypothetical protein